MTVPAECPQCEADGRKSRHWVESENYPGDTPLPVLTLCPDCRERRAKAIAQQEAIAQESQGWAVMTRNN